MPAGVDPLVLADERDRVGCHAALRADDGHGGDRADALRCDVAETARASGAEVRRAISAFKSAWAIGLSADRQNLLRVIAGIEARAVVLERGERVDAAGAERLRERLRPATPPLPSRSTCWNSGRRSYSLPRFYPARLPFAGGKNPSSLASITRRLAVAIVSPKRSTIRGIGAA